MIILYGRRNSADVIRIPKQLVIIQKETNLGNPNQLSQASPISSRVLLLVWKKNSHVVRGGAT